MADWQRTLDIVDPFQSAKAGELTPDKLAGEIAGRLKQLVPFDVAYIDEARDAIVDEFEDASKDDHLDVEDFDVIMDALYDWGDMPLDDRWNGKKVCWVKTF